MGAMLKMMRIARPDRNGFRKKGVSGTAIASPARRGDGKSETTQKSVKERPLVRLCSPSLGIARLRSPFCGEFFSRGWVAGCGLRVLGTDEVATCRRVKRMKSGSGRGSVARLCSPSLGKARLRSPFCGDVGGMMSVEYRIQKRQFGGADGSIPSLTAACRRLAVASFLLRSACCVSASSRRRLRISGKALE